MPDAPPDEAEVILRTAKALVAPLGQALTADTEVVLHDLRRLPDSVIATHGEFTSRLVGAPAVDDLLRRAAAGQLDTRTGYETRLSDGRILRSAMIVLPDSAGRPVAALCINSDVMIWRAIQAIAEAMLPTAQPPSVAPPVRDIDELAQQLLARAVEHTGAPVALMQKKHKIAVVAELKDGGFFLLKEAVEIAAQALQVTRFTIYNYLNELNNEERSGGASGPEAVVPGG